MLQKINVIQNLAFPMTSNYKSYKINDLDSITQLQSLSLGQIEEIKVVSEIYPFKTNNYVLENLIDWDNIPQDPIFRINFPQKEMLSPEHFELLRNSRIDRTSEKHKSLINKIRSKMNPHPAGQLSLNIPSLNEAKLPGLQHKYKKTILFFPSNGQTCHAYCTFCFRWPQFIDNLELKIQSKEIAPLIAYIEKNKSISEVLFTGGDPMVMSPRVMEKYIAPLLELSQITTIRFGTKALSYWPQKFVTDPDSLEMFNLLKRITDRGKHISIMAHFNHPVELKPRIVGEAIANLRHLGVEIRTQSPLLKNINNRPEIWTSLWEKQVQLGCIPYYMFQPRDTGAQSYFAETLHSALKIYQGAICETSGLCRTVRGPIMSATNGKVEILDIDSGVYYLRFIQHRNPQFCYKIFRGKEKVVPAIWFDDLKAFSVDDEKYF